MTNSATTLIVGLGNPGPHYLATRHNVGFWIVDRIAAQASVPFRQEARFLGEVARVNDYWLLKPSTFMNRSGQSIVALAQFYKFSPEQLLIIHDDLDLPPGTARLKQGGGHGGHNGLKDTIAHLNSPNFLRLRIGIGHPGRSSDVSNYVLHAPTSDERIAIENSIDQALAVMPLILQGELAKAMQQLHSK